MKQLFAASFKKLFTGGILLGFFAGCSVLDPAEDIPSYLHIESISLSVPNPGINGTSKADILDAWIFMDGKLIGAFELPCNVPIIAEGVHTFSIRGGVRMNGLSSTRAIYPAWKAWDGSATLVRGQKVNIAPVVTYYPALNISGDSWLCDFEATAGTNFDHDPSSSALLVRVGAPDNYDSLYSGYVHLNTDSTFFFGRSAGSGFIMPTTTDTWLEFDYKSDMAFTVGIKHPTNSNYIVGWLAVQPNVNWTKVYVRLTDPLAEAQARFGYNNGPAVVPYQIYFGASTTVSQSQANIYLDNIKLLK